MATPGRALDLDVSRKELRKQLEEAPYSFEFFQAVRLLERLSPEGEMIGRFVQPSQEVVRFAAHTSLAFPASEIQDLEKAKEPDPANATPTGLLRPKRPPVMKVNFFGLTGTMGVLPLGYSEVILERARDDKDHVLREFLDIFNHRLISLFYQAWEKYRFGIAFERGELDRVSHHLFDIIGLDAATMLRRQAVNDYSLIFYSGLLAQKPRSATALEGILADYFQVPVQIEQFCGAWYRLPKDSVTVFNEGMSLSECLGLGAVVGDEVWDEQAGVRVCLGPLTIEQYLDFLPGRRAYDALRAMVRYFANDELDFQLKLILKKDHTPGCELGGAGATSPRLGWVSWIKNRPLFRDPGETILRL